MPGLCITAALARTCTSAMLPSPHAPHAPPPGDGLSYRALAEMASALAAHRDESEVFALAAHHATTLLAAPYARLWVVESDGSLRCVAAEGAIDQHGACRYLAAASFTGAVVRGGRTVRLSDAPSEPSWVDETFVARTGLRAYLGAPLRGTDTTFGVLEVMRPGGNDFTAEEEALMQGLADAAAVAADNARMLCEARAELAQRRQTEEALRASEARFRAVWDAAASAMVLSDPHGTVVAVNPAYCALYGLTEAQAVGHTFSLIFPEEARPSAEEAYQAVFSAAQTPGSFEARVRGPDGEERIVDSRATFLETDGQRVALLSIVRDVTEQRRAEAQKEVLARGEKLRALGQMASGIAHDLNQQLTLVAGYGDLARQALEDAGGAPPEVLEALRIMTRAAMDGGQTVKRVLTFARGSTGGHPERFDVGTLLREVAQLTAPRWRDVPQVEGRPISLLVEAPPGLEILGWPHALREAVTNLIFNAVDALPRGGSICLRARQDGQRVLVEVVDTGVGMTADVRERLFEPFFTTKGERGTGLGLPGVYGIVQRHGGEIEVTSEPGRGTTVRLSFRLQDHEATRLQALKAGEDAATPTARVLAVDDEPALLQMMKHMLGPAGHEVVVAGSGEEALDILEAEDGRFDVLLTDLGLGAGINGWELIAVVRARWPQICILLATGWGAEIPFDQARTRGVDHVVPKPYRQADLLALLRERPPSGMPAS